MPGQPGRCIPLLFVAALVSCRSPAKTSGPLLSETIETEHFSFHYSRGDHVDPVRQEKFYAWAVQALGVEPVRKIVYDKYLSREHMGGIINVWKSNAFAQPASNTLHTIWPADNHETVHLVTAVFANPGPVALFNEGIAVAHQVDPARGDFTPRWSGTPLDDAARAFQRNGQLPALSAIIETKGFRAIDGNVAYPVAGSFVQYVLGRFGLSAIKEFFRRGTPNDTAATVRHQFLAVFGVSCDQVEQDWLKHLGG